LAIKSLDIMNKDGNSSTLKFELRLDRFLQQGVLALVILALITFIAYKFTQVNKVYPLTLAGGDSHSESYLLSRAIAQVVEANQPRLHLQVIPTGGTVENISLLEAGKVQLATAQADMPAGSLARAIAVLYRDLFLLVVKKNSEIHHFVELKGKLIGLAPSSGQFHSFMEVADHYGLAPEAFQFVGTNPQQVSEAFRQNRIDALFSARAPGSQAIAEFIQKYQGQVLPIEQAEAMQIQYPAFKPAIVPQGTYQGNPAIPPHDIQTVAVEHLLLTSRQTDDWIVREITRILTEHRQQIIAAIPPEFADLKPLVAKISRPDATHGISIATHHGAIAYYERNRPSFVEEHASLLSLILSIVTLIGSGFVGLRVRILQNQKDKTDEYIKLATRCLKIDKTDRSGVLNRQQELDAIFEHAVEALTREEISQESFRTFNEVYKDVREALERKLQP
jgi:TRAP transporter TAXI family solute receptor